MNENTNQSNTGFTRRCAATGLLAMAAMAAAVGVAATSHADTAAPVPSITVTVPELATPWIPAPDRFGGCWRTWRYYNGRWRCG
jgi:hypothetical protein